MLDRTQQPTYHSITGFDLIKPQRITFSNGLNVFVFNAGEQDVVRIEWIFDHVFSEENQLLLHSCLCESLLEGTSAYTSAQIAEMVDFHGAFLVPEYGYDRSSLTLFSLNKHLANLLPLVKDVLTDSIFPEQELATYIRNNKQKLQISLKKNSFAARRLFNRTLFGHTRYGYVPELSDYDGLSREALLDLFRRQYTSSNGTLIIAGKVTDDTITQLEALFGATVWPSPISSVPQDQGPHLVSPSGTLLIDEREDAMQSAIRMGCLSIQRTHPDFPGLQVLNTALGGYFGSRLMANIREDKGYTYSIGSGLMSLKHTAFFTLSSEVGLKATAPTLAEIEKEISRLRDELISESELSVVRNYLMGSMLGSLENVFSHADKFKNVYFSGLDLDYYDYYAQVVNAITPDEMRRLARLYLNYEQMIKVVVGKVE